MKVQDIASQLRALLQLVNRRDWDSLRNSEMLGRVSPADLLDTVSRYKLQEISLPDEAIENADVIMTDFGSYFVDLMLWSGEQPTDFTLTIEVVKSQEKWQIEIVDLRVL